MRLKLYVGLALAFLIAGAASSALAQTVPAATGPKAYSPLAVGAGFSVFDPGWTNGHMLGGTLWIDYTPNSVPHFLRGIGVEVEARDINIETNAKAQYGIREDVASGGVIYSMPRFGRFRPYAKYLVGFGNCDYPTRYKPRYHQTRTVTSVGGGLDYRAFKSKGIWLRADYEYQFWSDFFIYSAASKKPPGILSPSGFTIGAMYHF